ncbi:MAG: hypothetical protein AB1498_02265 [bacterium]
MYKTIEAYYENGKIIYREDMPVIKKAKLIITIIEDLEKNHKLSRYRGILKKKVDGLKYQKKIRNEWS